MEEKNRISFNKILSGLTVFCILLCFCVYFKNIFSNDIFGTVGSNPIICYLQLPLSVLVYSIAFFRKKLYRYFDILMVILFFFWFGISIFANREEESISYHYSYLIAFASVLLPCSILPYVAEKEKSIGLLKFIAGLYVLVMIVIAIIGLTFAMRGISIDNPSIGIIFDGRLQLFGTPNMVAIEMMIGIGLILLFLCKKRSLFIYILAAIVIALFAIIIVLTDCRSVKLAVLPIIFLFAFLRAESFFSNKKYFVSLLISAGIAFVACAAFWLFFSLIYKLNARFEIIGIPESVAEEASKYGITGLSGRGITEGMNSNFGNRLPMWKYAIETILQDTRRLIFGATPAMSHDLFLLDNYEWENYVHFHNAYIAILTSFGVVGLLLFFVYCIGFAKCTLQMIFQRSGEYTIEERFIPATAIAILIIFIVEECILTLGYYTVEGIWLVILCAFCFCMARKEKKLDS